MEDKTKQQSGKIKSILDNVIEDFNSKWSSHSEKRAGINEATNEILQIFVPSTESESVPSAEEYFEKEFRIEKVEIDNLKQSYVHIMESYRDLCVEQKQKEWEKEKQELYKMIRTL